MEAPLALCPARHRFDASSASSLPASCQESAPSTFRPITHLAAHQLELLLLGCGQASRPILCDPNFNGVVLDKHHHDRPQHLSSTLVTPTSPLEGRPDNAVNTALKGHPDFTLIYDSRSEIGCSPSPTSTTTRYRTNTHRSFTHSFENTLYFGPSNTTRPLIAAIDASQLTMNATASAPGSPPDLSGSRSSKSSSCCSTSQESNPDGIATDVSNFEDIGLDDGGYGKADEPQKASLLRSVTTCALVHPPSTSRHPDPRPTLPSLQHQVREAIRQKENGIQVRKGTNFASMRRGFTSPAAPLATIMRGARPRSSSPPKRIPTSHSTTALSADTLRPQWSGTRSSLPLPPRRTSWQRRKSIQELEAEYHDSDEELPEDASLWNVPVSPHPGDRSASSSFHGSPVREPVARSPRPIPLAHSATAPEMPSKPPLDGHNLPRQRPPPPRSLSLTTSLSNPSSPRSQRFQRAGRAKSWHLAMEDLSEEAKIISEALEHHAEESRRIQQGHAQASSSRDSLSGGGAVPKAHQIQLPPVQKGSLDFMPISKEKEAILSRTRPSWLPPKDPKEEKRHLKEYQQMMAASLEAEKKKQERQRSHEWEEDTTRDALDRIWHFYCEESTDLSVIDKRVFELCWRGISPKLRGRVWQRAIGNPLGLTGKSYAKALSRAQEIQSQSTGQLSERERHMTCWFKDIERDAETAFPELNVFQRNGPLWQDLIDVCKAYACYRSDIGYLYGMQLCAALLLLQLPQPADVFVLLANCFNRALPLGFQSGDITTTARTYNHAVSTLAIKFPRLHDYLFGSIEQGALGFTGKLIFEPMIRTLFCNGLDIDRLCRFWDLWVFEGDQVIVRTAVAVLGCLQTQLFEVQGDIDLRRRNIQEMLAWGPFNRTDKGGHWDLSHIQEESFAEEVRLAGQLDYRLK